METWSADQSKTDQQDRLHQTFTAALDHLDKECREPDRWEEECLSYALGAIACGLYPAAEVELVAFWRPENERPEDEVAVLEGKPRRFTKDMLRHGLAYVAQRARENEAPTDAPLAVASHLAVRSFLSTSL
jgi:hypothetical protein